MGWGEQQQQQNTTQTMLESITISDFKTYHKAVRSKTT
jgi:hypothetical protein